MIKSLKILDERKKKLFKHKWLLCAMQSILKNCMILIGSFQIYFIISSITISLFIYTQKRYEIGEQKDSQGLSLIGDTPSKCIRYYDLVLTYSTLRLPLSHCDIQRYDFNKLICWSCGIDFAINWNTQEQSQLAVTLDFYHVC
jgi:hypothetical protein